MDQEGRRLPPEFWSAPAVAAALECCDFPVLLEEVRLAHGWTQRQLAAATGYSQSWVSNVLRGKQALTVDQVREISHRTGIPVHLLRFGTNGGEEPVKRRDFGKAVALALLPLPSSPPADEATAATLTAITGAQRRLDATSSARELSKGVTAHADMASRLLARADGTLFALDIAAAASEAAGFAAWLHADMQDLGTARAYYRMAIDHARRARHGLLVGYMLGSLAAFETDAGDPDLGLACLTQAHKLIGTTDHPAPRAWLDANEAVILAAQGRSEAAGTALDRAARTIDQDHMDAAPPWPWVFAFGHPKLAGYRALAEVRRGRPGAALDAFTESLATAQPAPKQRAIIMLEVATAARQDGISRHDTVRVDEAFRLACEAHATGVAYSSERVTERVRQFRRSYSGPPTPYVRHLSDRLNPGLP
jgi:transcriptional regulator with XRE-family HTH domain